MRSSQFRIRVLLLTFVLVSSAVLAQTTVSATWARGVEGQRKADMGDGRYLNPIFPGDHPDPSVLKDGSDYYMVHSSFESYPGLMIWHSRDLVNWEPVGPALTKNVGSVWAPDIVKHKGRYYIYFPGKMPDYSSNYVVWADNIRGPWSAPIDLKTAYIDPGHAVGEDGKRYLFFSGGTMAPLSDDGLSLLAQPRKVYSPWRYPDEWIVEGFAPEGPKILKHGSYYYMILAEGGTAGPATSHMVVMARSKSILGPWENSPYNPVIRTQSAAERWWSRGHATAIEGPDGKWYVVYHAYENGFYTLGRQTLLEPVAWTADGWLKATGADVSKPMAKPTGGQAVQHGMAFSDDFSQNKMGVQWSFYNGDAKDVSRYRYENGALVVKAKGGSPADCSPLSFVAGDQAYQIEVEVEIDPGATAGLLLFYNRRLYAGFGLSDKALVRSRYGLDQSFGKPDGLGRVMHIRLVNDRNIVSIYYSPDGKTWQRWDTRMDVSGYHHNTMGDFLSLRPALYAAGTGEVRFRNFTYRALP